MKKILLAFDGTSFSEGAFEFADRLNQMRPILLTGIFMPQLSISNLWSYADGMAGPAYVPILEKEDSDQIEKNIKRFEKLCRQSNISYSVHKDFYNFALPELKKETRFADLLILGSETFYDNILTEKPSDYMKDALHSAECPVVVVPERYHFPKKNIIAYDGSESSVYAIKQFAYLFPEFRNKETLIVYSSANEDEDLPHEVAIQELVKEHFYNASFIKLDVSPKKAFGKWISESNNVILVSGSYGRSSFSQLFKRSFADGIIGEHKLPVFIAHK